MKKKLWLLAALTLPVLYFFCWKSGDKVYPKNDEGFYIVITQELYNNFDIMSAPQALAQIYLHRHWKPILHPIMALPALILTGGDIRTAVFIYNGLMFSLLLAIVFLFLSRYLRRESAVLGTLTMGFVPWVFGMSTTFNSELTFVTAVLGFFFYTSENFDFSNTRRCIIASLWLALMVCLRPVETALLFAFPVVAFVIFSFLKKLISGRDILSMLVWLLFLCFTIIPPYFVFERKWSDLEVVIIDLVALAYLLIMTLFSSRFSLQKNFQIFFGLFFFVMIFWFAPGAKNLFEWIVIANFKYMAIHTGNRAGKPLADFLWFYLSRLGIVPLLLMILSLAVCTIPARSALIRTTVYIIGILIIPLLAGMASYNGDVRYYYGAWAIILLMLLKIALNHRLAFYRTRWLFIFVLTIGLFGNLVDRQKNSYSEFRRYSDLLGLSFFPSIPRPAEPSIGAYEKLAQFISPAKQTVQTYFLTRNLYPYVIDHWTLRLIAGEHGQFWEFYNPHLNRGVEVDFLLQEAKTYDYILVGPTEDDWSETKNGVVELTRRFMAKCESPDSADLKTYQYLGKFTAETDSGKVGTFCIFLNTTKPDSTVKKHYL